MRMFKFFILAFFLSVSPVMAADSDNNTLIVTTVQPPQGSCVGNLVNASTNISTIACPGISNTPMNFTYGNNGVREACLYIDNTSNNAFFTPMRTQGEWLAFRQAVASGRLKDNVSLSYGCNTAAVTDNCGNPLNLPAARNDFSVTAPSGARYTCQGAPGCGAWVNTAAATCTPPPLVCNGGTDVVFALDVSGSIGKSTFYNKLEPFSVNLVKKMSLEGNEFAGYLTFTNKIIYQSPMYNDINALYNDLINYKFSDLSGSDMSVAFLQGAKQLADEDDGNKKVIVMISDFKHNTKYMSKDDLFANAAAVKAAGTRIIGIGVGSVKETYLDGITSGQQGTNEFLVKDPDAIDSVLDQLADTICNPAP